MAEPLNSASLVAKLGELGLEQYSISLVPLLKSSIGVITHPADEMTIPIGASKFGGSPDLPSNEIWPELYGQALDFIAQINLADVLVYDIEHQLPSSGILFFFHNESRMMALESFSEKSIGTVLFYNGDVATLERREAPYQQYYTACTLLFVADATLPRRWDLEGSGILETMSEHHQNLYDELVWHMSVVSYTDAKANRMLGYPEHVQGSPFIQTNMIDGAESFELTSVNSEWVLLLQVDSDNNANMFWGDYGTLYFCIKKEDLEKHRFNRAIVVSQST